MAAAMVPGSSTLSSALSSKHQSSKLWDSSRKLLILRASRKPRRLATNRKSPSCQMVEIQDQVVADCGLSLRRRQVLLSSLAGLSASSFLTVTQPCFAKDVAVGAYLPPASSAQGFVQFVATSKDTPALRAGNVQPYRFILPPSWKQVRVANILSGNYCQPKCAEPWVEVKFEDAKQGTAQVFASPMVRLTNKPNAKIEEIGSPEKLISALGPFVTGNSYDPDEVVETRVEQRNDQTYYVYGLETPFAKTGTHNLAAATAKGNVVLLFVVSCNDSQWASSEAVLKTILESFEA